MYLKCLRLTLSLTNLSLGGNLMYRMLRARHESTIPKQILAVILASTCKVVQQFESEASHTAWSLLRVYCWRRKFLRLGYICCID
jgi:hypothetical protein